MMKINFRYLAYVLIIVFPFISSCRPDPPVVPNQCSGCIQYHVSDVKNWLYFQSGTYWIYEEATSGAIDSVYVTSNTYDDGNSQSAFFRCETFSSYYNYYFNYLSDNSNLCDNTFWGEKRCIIVRRSKYYPGDFVGETITFFYRPRTGDYGYTWNNTGSITSVENCLDSLVIDSSIYYQVSVMKETINITEERQSTKFYYSEHIGIIKKELLDSNQVWNLIRYNIVQ